MQFSDLQDVEFLAKDKTVVTASVVLDTLQTLAALTSELRRFSNDNTTEGKAERNFRAKILSEIYDDARSDNDRFLLTASALSLLGNFRASKMLIEGREIKPELVPQFKAVVKDVLMPAVTHSSGDPYEIFAEYYEEKFEALGWRVKLKDGFAPTPLTQG